MSIYTHCHSSYRWRVWDWCVGPRVGIKGQGSVCWAKDGHGVSEMDVEGFGWVRRA